MRFLGKHIYLACLFLAFVPYSQAQNETTSKISPRIELNYFEDSDEKIHLNARLSHRVDKQIIYTENVSIEFYAFEKSEETKLGSSQTDAEGRAELIIEDKSAFKDSLRFTIYAVNLENDTYSSKSKSISIVKAKLMAKLLQDSANSVEAIFTKDSLGETLPIKETEIKFYVKRMFGLLPFGGSYTYTDDNGRVQVPFPTDLPGDENGNLEIVVKVQDNEYFGNIEKRLNASWGVPLVIDNSDLNQTLWSTSKNAPIPLIVISCLLIAGIWGVIVYLVILLLKIKKIGKNPTSNY